MDSGRFYAIAVQISLIFLVIGCSEEKDRPIYIEVISTSAPTSSVSNLPPSNCVIGIKEETLGIIIYKEGVLNDPENLRRYDTGERFRADDGRKEVEGEIKWDNQNKFQWAQITVYRDNPTGTQRKVTGWVHADRPWTQELPECADKLIE